MAIGGSVGVVMVSLRLLMNTVQWGMLQATQTENYMTSTERVLEYGALEVEGAALEQGPEIPSGYQHRREEVIRGGEIEFKDVSLSYCGSGEKKRVLKDVNLKIRSGERVNINGGNALDQLAQSCFLNFSSEDWRCWQDRSWKVLSCVRPAEASGANQGNCYGRRPGSVQDGSLRGPPLCRPGPAAGRAHGWHTEVQLGPGGKGLR